MGTKLIITIAIITFLAAMLAMFQIGFDAGQVTISSTIIISSALLFVALYKLRNRKS